MSEQILKQIPLGVSDWQRLNKKLVVDKTAKLGALVSTFDKVFLSRPRRMGKTVLCSMLENLFTYGDEGFKGKAIYGNWPDQNERFPVINISFINMDCSDASKFENSLCKRLVTAYASAGFDTAQYIDISSFAKLSALLDILSNAAQKDLVFLIDEWDHPLSVNLSNNTLFAEIQAVLRLFYAWLRAQKNIRFILVTGIMRYRDASLFTGQDIQDISMNPNFADLLGYTREEIQSTFKPYIPAAAQSLDMSESELLHQLELHYDGFCFDYNAKVKVYCPLSINQFFAPIAANSLIANPDWAPSFSSYWMDSSNASDALRSFLRGRDFKLDELVQKYSKPVILGNSDLATPTHAASVTLNQIMAQSGFLTIKQVTDATKNLPPKQHRFICGLTNYEVMSEYVVVLSTYMSQLTEDVVYEQVNNARIAFLDGDIAQTCASLNVLLSTLRFDVMASAQEKHYRTFISIWLRSNKITVDEEYANNLGLCDLIVTTEDHVYAIELKRLSVDDDKSDAAKIARLDDGTKQLLEKGYASNVPSAGKLITGVVLVICDKHRQICAWRTIDAQGSQEGLVDHINVLSKNL